MYTFTDLSQTKHCITRPRRLHGRCGIVVSTLAAVPNLPFKGQPLHSRFAPADVDYYVSRKGDVFMFTPSGKYVQHLPRTRYNGIRLGSDDSSQMYVGVGLEVEPTTWAVPSIEQYVATASLLRALIERHHIPMFNIVERAMVVLDVASRVPVYGLDWTSLSVELVAPSFEGGYLVFPGDLS